MIVIGKFLLIFAIVFPFYILLVYAVMKLFQYCAKKWFGDPWEDV